MTMRLYYSPFACSLATHIACREAGLEPELVRVDLPSKRKATGGDLFGENPMGQVPTLVLEDGRTLTESVAVLSYVADRQAGAQTPDAAPSDRYEVLRWLSFVSSEIHKRVLWPIFSGAPDAVKSYARDAVKRPLDVVASRLASRDTLVDPSFTVADAYLFWALTILPHAGVSLDPWPALGRHHALHKARPAVRAALAFEKEQHERPFALV